MNRPEAEQILAKLLQQYRKMSHADLARLIDNAQTIELAGNSGTKYGVEIEVFWDHQPGQDLRVIGSIDDGGWRAFAPLTQDFIMRPDGTFVGETAPSLESSPAKS
jgi:hypothetical protein